MASQPNRTLPVGVLLVASLLAGAALTATLFFTFGDFGTSARTDSERLSSSESADPASAMANTDTSRSVDGSSSSDQKLTNLSALAQFDSEFERNLALYNYVDRLAKDRLLELLTESKEIEPSVQLTAQRVILERLASLDPILAMSRAESMVPALTTTVFFQWSLTDLNEAIAYANSLDQTRKDAALRGILTSRNDLPEEVRIEIGKQFDNEQLARSTINSANLGEYLKSPGDSWNEIIKEAQHDPLQIGLLHTLAQRWFEQEGLVVLDHISASLTDERTRESILGSVVHMATRSDPQGAFERVLKISSDINSEIVFDVARQWASNDPESALRAVSVLEGTRLRGALLNLVLQAWANDDSEAMVAELDQFSDEIHDIGLGIAINVIAQEYPERAVQMISRIGDSKKKNDVLYAVALKWSRQDPGAALDWVLTDGEVDQVREQLLPTVLSLLVESDFQLAFETALAQSTVENKPGLEAMVIAQLAHSDVEKALRLLPRVRDGVTKLSAYGMVGMAMIENGDTSSAIELAPQLPESDQEKFFLLTAMAWADHDSENLLESIGQISSPVARSKAAAVLTFMNQFEKSLTAEQVVEIKEYLSDEDAKSLEEGGAGLLNPLMQLGLM